MNFTLTNQLEQRQTLSQQQIYSLHVLAMNNYDLKCFLQEQELQNPLVSVEYDQPERLERYQQDESGALTQVSVEYREEQGQRSYARKSTEPSDYYDIPNQQEESTADFLRSQLNHFTCTPREEQLLNYLVELVDAAQWFVTRLNTNGRLLTPELCRGLFEASLDSVQVTLYAADAAVQDRKSVV